MRLFRTRIWLIYAPLGWLPLELLLELLFEYPAGGPADYEIETSVRLYPVVID